MSNLYIGTQHPKNIFLGRRRVNKVYLGLEQVWGLIPAGEKPFNTSPMPIYTGSVITNGYTCPEHVFMTGNDSGISCGTYVATYTPESGYCWSDGSSGSVTITLEIVRKELCVRGLYNNTKIKIVHEGKESATNPNF